MPPIIALTGCLLFIAYLFITDSRHRGDTSSGMLWIPLIWIVIIGSRPIALWLNMGTVVTAEDLMDGSTLDRNIFIGLMLLGIAAIAKRNVRWSQLFASNPWIIVMLGYGAISILWSDYPFVSLKRWVRGFGGILVILIILTSAEPGKAVSWILRRFAYLTIPLSIVLIKYFPQYGTQYDTWSGLRMISGVAGSKNELGMICLMNAYYYFWYVRSYKKNIIGNPIHAVNTLIMIAMIVWLFLQVNSSTAIVCFLVGGGFLLFSAYAPVRRSIRYIGLYFLAAILVYFIIDWSFDIKGVIIRSLGRNETLTDRTYIWKALLDFGTNPWIGTGFESFWLGERLLRLWSSWEWGQISEAHNGYLEIYLNQGILGLLLFFIVVIESYRKIKIELMTNFDYGSFQMGLLILMLLYNYSEAGFKVGSIILLFFWIIALNCPSIHNNNPQVEESKTDQYGYENNWK